MPIRFFSDRRCVECGAIFTPTCGAQKQCKACAKLKRALYRKRYHQLNRDRELADRKRRYQLNREHILIQHRKRYREIMADPALKAAYTERKRKEHALRRAKRDIITPNDKQQSQADSRQD